jgi:hypothetical protein
MFRTGLLPIIRRYFSVYTAIVMCHAFMLATQPANLCHVSTDNLYFFLYMYNIYMYVKQVFTNTQNRPSLIQKTDLYLSKKQENNSSTG